jgi:hypothetical protein
VRCNYQRASLSPSAGAQWSLLASHLLLLGGAVEFTQEMIDVFLTCQIGANGIFSGLMAAFTPTLPPFFLRSIVHLCISGAPRSAFWK